MMAVVCSISLISCGGDKEDDVPDIPSTATYYEPCFDWGSNVDHVKAYMAGWQLMDGSNDYVLVYTNSKSTTNVNYSFIGGNGLSCPWPISLLMHRTSSPRSRSTTASS